MNNVFFTSDLHLGEPRLTIFQRPFNSVKQQDETIFYNWNTTVSPEDTVYVVGDVLVNLSFINILSELKGHKHLIVGNYDEDKIEALRPYFESIQTELTLELNGRTYYLNHYPNKAKADIFSIVGHVHSLWKVQRNMINVSTDAWNFKPVSLEQIEFLVDGIENYYDINVFAGELQTQMHGATTAREITPNMPLQKKGFTVFLAGPTPRGNRENLSWRIEFVKKLINSGFKGTLINPELDNDEDYDYVNQVDWEYQGLNMSDIIVFWVPRDLKDMPAFTTNVEFGEWMTSGKCILGYPTSAPKMRYLHSKAIKYNIPVVHTEDKLIELILEKQSVFYANL